MPMYPLDNSEDGSRARRLASDPATAMDYVLKPSLEGGGHNIYGEAIPEFLAGLTDDDMAGYILMAKITPPEIHGGLMSWSGQYHGPVVSELGIFSTCLWSRVEGDDRDSDGETERRGTIRVEKGTADGSRGTTWSFKTKAADVDEMSVVKGFGCFDSPLLVDC